jgi:hypothetical protein
MVIVDRAEEFFIFFFSPDIGIDNKRVQSFIAGDQIAVSFDGSKNEVFNEHTSYYPRIQLRIN